MHLLHLHGKVPWGSADAWEGKLPDNCYLNSSSHSYSDLCLCLLHSYTIPTKPNFMLVCSWCGHLDRSGVCFEKHIWSMTLNCINGSVVHWFHIITCINVQWKCFCLWISNIIAIHKYNPRLLRDTSHSWLWGRSWWDTQFFLPALGPASAAIADTQHPTPSTLLSISRSSGANRRQALDEAPAPGGFPALRQVSRACCRDLLRHATRQEISCYFFNSPSHFYADLCLFQGGSSKAPGTISHLMMTH